MSGITKIRFAIERNLLRVKQISLLVFDWVLLQLAGSSHLDLSDDSGRRVILFLGEFLQGRIPRLAKWISRSGNFSCVLLVASGKDYSILERSVFSRVITYRSRPHLERILRGLRGISLIHAYSLPNFHIKMAIDFADAPVVMDTKDMYVSYFGLQSPKLYMRLDMPNEKASITGASGVVCQSMELLEACRTYRIVKRPPTLFFPVYCDDDQFAESPYPETDEIHVVYAGAVAGSFQDDEHFGSMKLFWLIDELSDQKIHLHVYPSPAIRFKDLILEEYTRVDKDNPYFHLHDSIPLRELSREMSKYHFGILPFYLEDTGRSATKLGRGSSLKLFNYLEAGIPVIISRDLAFQHWIASRYGAALAVGRNDYGRLGEIIEGADPRRMRQNTARARERLAIGQNIDRLLHFYEKTILKEEPLG